MTPLLQAIDDRSARVAIVGQGYVGLPVAMRCIEVGFPTVGFDIDASRISELSQGVSHVSDVPDEVLRRALQSGYRPTADPAELSDFDVAVVSVPTPLKDGSPDLSAIEAAGRAMGRHLRPGSCVILESTTYPGTTEELLGPILTSESGLRAGEDFYLGYSPERIDPGNQRWGFVNTPKVVSGVNGSSLAVVDAFFSSLIERTVPVGSCAEAETTKLLENTFRHINIALINELAVFAHELGVDIWAVVAAASTKPFGFMRFTPGPGVGGHCLPIDPTYLSWRVKQDLGRPFRFVDLANEVNEQMPEHVVDRVVRLLNDRGRVAKGARALMLGLAYKAGTGDWRESPSVPVLRALRRWGVDVEVCDPFADPSRLPDEVSSLVAFSESALSSADVVIVMVDHPEFDPHVVAVHSRLVFDAKGLLRGQEFVGEHL